MLKMRLDLWPLAMCIFFVLIQHSPNETYSIPTTLTDGKLSATLSTAG